MPADPKVDEIKHRIAASLKTLDPQTGQVIRRALVSLITLIHEIDDLDDSKAKSAFNGLLKALTENDPKSFEIHAELLCDVLDELDSSEPLSALVSFLENTDAVIQRTNDLFSKDRHN